MIRTVGVAARREASRLPGDRLTGRVVGDPNDLPGLLGWYDARSLVPGASIDWEPMSGDGIGVLTRTGGTVYAETFGGEYETQYVQEPQFQSLDPVVGLSNDVGAGFFAVFSVTSMGDSMNASMIAILQEKSSVNTPFFGPFWYNYGGNVMKAYRGLAYSTMNGISQKSLSVKYVVFMNFLPGMSSGIMYVSSESGTLTTWTQRLIPEGVHFHLGNSSSFQSNHILKGRLWAAGLCAEPIDDAWRSAIYEWAKTTHGVA